MDKMNPQKLIRLDQEDIQSILPHQPPFVHINEVFDLVPGKSAKALKYIDPEDPIFTCHFPGNPIYPGIFLIEAAAQLAFVTFCYKQDSKVTTYSRAGYLGTVKNFVFKNVVTPGMRLTIELEVIARLGNAAKVSTKISCQEKIMANGELYFTIDEGRQVFS
ncbi:beta-hydroxyacyl-ACP dehydratase [Candidatus Aerophobetes bacterium]|nr:beta-hydroxyacyl-ACP dehydratase [Candidatus Aerophobetes bacterium]